jgi:hypothetical protein
MKYLLLIFLFILSCSDTNKKISFSEDKQSELKSILSTDSLYCLRDDTHYKLIVKYTKLKTELGKEMGASISALIIYEEVVNDNPLLEYNTTFDIIYSGKDSTYSYTLQNLSDVIKGQILIDDIIMDLKKNKSSSKNFDNDELIIKLTKSNIDWSKIQDISFGGFQIGKDINQKNIILYRIFVNPHQSELWFYLDKINKKIVQIDLKDTPASPSIR